MANSINYIKKLVRKWLDDKKPIELVVVNAICECDGDERKGRKIVKEVIMKRKHVSKIKLPSFGRGLAC